MKLALYGAVDKSGTRDWQSVNAQLAEVGGELLVKFAIPESWQVRDSGFERAYSAKISGPLDNARLLEASPAERKLLQRGGFVIREAGPGEIPVERGVVGAAVDAVQEVFA